MGFGSVSRELIDSKSLVIVKAGLQLTFKISKQILPWELILGWYIRVINFTFGGLKGYLSVKFMLNLKNPPA